MKCSKCGYYSFPLQRCRDGKINPKTIKGGVEAAKIMGTSYICPDSSLRQKILLAITKEARSILFKVERELKAEGLLDGPILEGGKPRK